MKNNLLEKLKESLQSVLPIGIIVLLLHFTIAPMPGGTLALMLVGMVLLIVGLTLFSLGTDMAMMPIGQHIGSSLLKSRNLPFIVISLFILGALVTAAEPDLSVLANQVHSISNTVLIFGIAAGVGIFLVLATLRILLKWKLSHMLMILYGISFLVAIFSSDYLAIAFDASAVTTGPITVPFLLAVGAGYAAISSGKDAEEANFGICAICSIGPILAVLVMGFFSPAAGGDPSAGATASVANAGELLAVFAAELWHELLNVAKVVIPIFIVFMVFQVTRLKLSRTELVRIFVGLGYLLVGLTIFLAGVNGGFMPAAKYLGSTMGALPYNWVLIPLCVVIGACVVIAEPAVHVLTKQVSDVTDGAISRTMMLTGMALGVGIAMSLAMVRIIADISIWWILVPGYILALALTFFVPKIFVGIGFDSGGVAAGAMSAAFVLPFTIGAYTGNGGMNVMDAFGVVGMIAMMPPITVQIMGILYKAKLRRAERAAARAMESDAAETEETGQDPFADL